MRALHLPPRTFGLHRILANHGDKTAARLHSCPALYLPGFIKWFVQRVIDQLKWTSNVMCMLHKKVTCIRIFGGKTNEHSLPRHRVSPFPNKTHPSARSLKGA
jgi:hypothetical protein